MLNRKLQTTNQCQWRGQAPKRHTHVSHLLESSQPRKLSRARARARAGTPSHPQNPLSVLQDRACGLAPDSYPTSLCERKRGMQALALRSREAKYP